MTADITKAHQMLRHLREQILSGDIAPGTVLPTPQQAARRWQTEGEYVRRVYWMLRQEGLVHGHPYQAPVVSGEDGAVVRVPPKPRRRPGPRPRPRPRTDLPVFAALAARRSGVPLRDHLADIIRDRIQAGDWQAGAKLPSAREMARHADCSDTPVHQALEVLEDEGLVERAFRRGWFLVEAGG